MSIKKNLCRKILPVLFAFVFLLTAAMAEITAIQANAVEYSYSCRGFYSEPYIFEIGWNISDKTAETLHSKKLALSDNALITVWYDDSLKADMSLKNVTAALTKVLSRIKSEYPGLARPVVLEIKDTSSNTRRS